MKLIQLLRLQATLAHTQGASADVAQWVSLLFVVETTLGKVLSHEKTQLDRLTEPTCGGDGLHINTQNGKRKIRLRLKER